MRNEVQSITDSQNRNAKLQYAFVGRRGIIVVNRTGATGQDDSSGRIAFDFIQGRCAGKHYREDALFADASRDQLRVLRAKVEDDDGFGIHA